MSPRSLKSRSRFFKGRRSKIYNKTVVLLKNTTWKCGRTQRRILILLKKKRRMNLGELYKAIKEIKRKAIAESLTNLRSRYIIKII